MTFEIPKTQYTGKVKEIAFGNGDKAVTVGGETAYPFHLFEGEMPNLPKIAMEVWDTPPEEWAEAALKPFDGVTDDPVAWAKKCIDDYGAEMIVLQLVSTDPNGLNRGADEAAAVVKKVADAIDIPLIVWGTANNDKDTEVLRKVAEVCEGKNLILGPVEEADHKKIGASAIGYKHTVIASSPIDINLAKQLIICNLANEVWKTKEVHLPDGEANMGDAEKRGIMMEAISAMVLLLAGGDVIIMRHPKAIKLVQEMIAEISAA